MDEWRIVETEIRNDGILWYAVMSSSRLIGTTGVVGDPEALRHAHLIAAAPDLLAALVECFERLHSYSDYCDDVTAAGLYNMARKAICKATGEG